MSATQIHSDAQSELCEVQIVRAVVQRIALKLVRWPSPHAIEIQGRADALPMSGPVQ